MSEPHAICSKCGQSKPVSQFPARADRPSGHASRCKECEKARQADYYARNKDRLAPLKAEKAAEWYEQNKADHIAKVSNRRKAKREG